MTATVWYRRRLIWVFVVGVACLVLQQVFGVPRVWVERPFGHGRFVVDMPSAPIERSRTVEILGAEHDVQSYCSDDRVAVPLPPLVGNVVYCADAIRFSSDVDDEEWFAAVIQADVVSPTEWNIVDQRTLTDLEWPAREITLRTKRTGIYWIRVLRMDSHAVLLTWGSFGRRAGELPERTICRELPVVTLMLGVGQLLPDKK